jgi:hypothetical protein
MLFKNLVKKATLNAQSILDTVGLLTGTVCLQRSTAQHSTAQHSTAQALFIHLMVG